MSKKVDFSTSIKGLGQDELKAKIAEDEVLAFLDGPVGLNRII